MPSRDPITCSLCNPFRPQLLVSFLVALAILFAGVRVPDLSGPQRPKPTHRIVVKAQQKTCSNPQKQSDDVVAVLPALPVLSYCATYHALSQIPPSSSSSPLLSTYSGRSPPAQNLPAQ